MKISKAKNQRPTAAPASFVIPSPEQDLQRLLCQVRLGDQQAFAQVYEATKSLVFGLILRIVGNHSTAEEVLLDVYLQAWRQAAKYDAQRGSPISWLVTIARSRAIDRLRAEKHIRKEVDNLEQLRASSASPEAASLLGERQRMVRAAFVMLPPEQCAVIELAYYAGLTQTEIAERLDCPLGTVKTRTRLAMMKLREHLSPLLSN